MPASSKILRAAPTRVFENYILTRVIDSSAGTIPIPDENMIHLVGTATETYSGGFRIDEGYSDDAASILTPIGFDFEFDGVTYKNFTANTNGFLILADPTTTSANNAHADVLTNNTGATWSNSDVLATIIKSVLICPWWDDQRTVSDSITKIGLTSEENFRIEHGLDLPPLSYNSVEWGVLVYYEKNSPRGPRTIIRWNTQSDWGGGGGVLKFDIVLYQNGTIEFRYVPRRVLSLTATNNEDATIAIFMPGSNRFRDFSFGLGYREQERTAYKYGGAIYEATFSDVNDTVSKPYVGNLKPTQHWPGSANVGATFIFQPPLNRRKVLPRVEIKHHGSVSSRPLTLKTGDHRSGNENVLFDDRRAVGFITGTIVNYPTTLQRFFANSEPGVALRQNLFTGDFETTGSITKSGIEQFISNDVPRTILAFSENKLFDQGPTATTDKFFTTGSIDFLKQPLRSKTQIRFTLPVDFTTTMFLSHSAIYYYNSKLQRWQIPQNSYSTTDSDISRPTYWASKAAYEDHRGFGPIGNTVSSGTLPGTAWSTDPVIGKFFNKENIATALTSEFAKSVSNYDNYKAIQDETFSIAINHPFVVEKAIIEIPLECGPTWFDDRTTTFQEVNISTPESKPIDFAGPALTLTLFNQIRFGSSARRDLIMSGTITHEFDNVDQIVASKTVGATPDVVHIRKEGFRSFAEPSAVIAANTVDGQNQFTGSATVRMESLTSNGLMIEVRKNMLRDSDASSNRTAVHTLLSQSQIVLPSSSRGQDDYMISGTIKYVNNFGRAATGFNPSGRSIFGAEFVTFQGLVEKGNRIDNPFYSTQHVSGQLDSIISANSQFVAHSMVSLESHFRSPYLLLPGDQLILAVSKTRPHYFSSTIGQETSASKQHDIKLKAGNVEITLYGSLLRADTEFHDTLNQPLSSDDVHSTIGDDVVLDQFDVSYRDEFINGLSDDYVTGSLVIKSLSSEQQTNFLTGSRGRVFSKHSARSAGEPDSISKAFRLQPWYERSGSPRVKEFVDESERYWDSLMPGVDGVFAADGTGIWLSAEQYFANDNAAINSASVGYMVFDFAKAFTAPGNPQVINDDWTKAYPFEPRYLGVSRFKDLSDSFNANYAVTIAVGGGSFNVTQLPAPKRVKGFFFGPTFPPFFSFASDVNLSSQLPNGLYLTGSASTDDIARCMYGFGDENSFLVIEGVTTGTNHFASFRDSHIEFVDPDNSGAPDYLTIYRFGPIIRGWKYGVLSGIPTFSKAFWRRNHYGQLRDMLEQRPFAKYFVEHRQFIKKGRSDPLAGPITVKFVDSQGNLTSPENTSSQNLSLEATSSFPYLDGHARNRPPINLSTLNTTIIGFSSDGTNNLEL